MRGDVTATPLCRFCGRRSTRRDGREVLDTSDRMLRQAAMGRMSAHNEKGPLARPFPDGSAKEKTGPYGFFGLTAGAAALSAGAAAVWVFAPTS